ncbi:hypothetical protein ILP97_24920 [Amycolatopsis sp. H6(2020)]|nr:hypothetical protein [Amycolatopsis sp. H6(2020)]
MRTISAAAKVSHGYLSEVLRGKTVPTPQTAVAIARALRATRDEQVRARHHAERAIADRTASGTARAGNGGPAMLGQILDEVRDLRTDLRQSSVGEVPRSAYIEQVRRIAPAELVGRERELAELAAFCTAGEGGGYRWWRGPAWAGKSALMSWFVLHPPPGVRVVSFFITARLAGQSDRGAFIEVVLEQLAGLLDRPVPAMLTEATREPHLLAMLTDAAQQCHRRGERLILVVDGLDEDHSSGGHSIAGLLPVRPLAGLRVAVTGRPNPPVPPDVRDDHPLRDPGIVRELSASAYAAIVRGDAERDLKALLRGSPVERDLLGLLTASVGGLSGADLAELTGQDRWEIDEHLHTVTGRMFARYPDGWQPGTAPEVYLLGHEQLQVTAARFLGPTRLDGYRQRLHRWADRYCARRWPPGTPQYLLRGYARMLIETGDLPRLVDLAVDPARQDRMLELSGGDAAALAEITAAQDLVLAQPTTDLYAMARLSIRRNSLGDRNTRIPAELPAVWERINQPDRAEALARSITDPYSQAQALTAVAWTAATAGNLDRAGRLARSITSPDRRAPALAAVARAAADAGDADRAGELITAAEQAARSIPDPYPQALALAEVAQAATASGDPDRAAELATAAEQIAWSITQPAEQARPLIEAAGAAGDVDRGERTARPAPRHQLRPSALAAVAKAAAANGDLDRAEQVARAITTSDKQAWALVAVAEAAAANGDLGRAEQVARAITNSDKQAWALVAVAEAAAANGDLDRAEQITRSLTDAAPQVRALSELVRVAAAAGGLGRAAELIIAAEQTAQCITDPCEQVQALGELVRVAAAAGGLGRAAELIIAAEQTAQCITDPCEQVQALGELVRVAAAAGGLGRAAELIIAAEQTAQCITDPCEQVQALGELVRVAAAAGGLGRAAELITAAEQTAQCITDPYPQDRASALAEVARAAAATGDPHRAAELATAAEQAAWCMTDPDRHDRASALAEVARAAAATGDPHRAAEFATAAEQVARSITDPYLHARALAEAARAGADAGDPDWAARLITAAEQAARSIATEYKHSWALAAVTRAAAAIGDLDRAEQIARSITPERQQLQELAAVARQAAAAGDLRRTEQIAWSNPSAYIRWCASMALAADAATPGEQIGRSITALKESARKVAAYGPSMPPDDPDRADDLDRAERVVAAVAVGDLDRAEKVARSTRDRTHRALALTTVAQATAAAGDLDRAEQIARSIAHPREQAQALITIAEVIGMPQPDRFLGAAFAVGSWTAPLQALAKLYPHVMAQIADDVSANDLFSPAQPTITTDTPPPVYREPR